MSKFSWNSFTLYESVRRFSNWLIYFRIYLLPFIKESPITQSSLIVFKDKLKTAVKQQADIKHHKIKTEQGDKLSQRQMDETLQVHKLFIGDCSLNSRKKQQLGMIPIQQTNNCHSIHCVAVQRKGKAVINSVSIYLTSRQMVPSV